jgi:hypothetical protein
MLFGEDNQFSRGRHGRDTVLAGADTDDVSQSIHGAVQLSRATAQNHAPAGEHAQSGFGQAGDGNYIFQVCQVALSLAVVSRSEEAAVCAETNRMKFSRRNGYNGIPIGYVALAVSIISHSHAGSVGSESNRMAHATAQVGYIPPLGGGASTVGVCPYGKYAAILSQSRRVRVPAGNLCPSYRIRALHALMVLIGGGTRPNLRECFPVKRFRIALAIVISTGHYDASVLQNGRGSVRACGHEDGVRIGREIALPAVVRPLLMQTSVGIQP